MFNAPSSGGGGSDRKHEPVSEGMHDVVCYALYDLGTHQSPFLDDRTGEPKRRHTIKLLWEVPAERLEYEYEGEKVNRPKSIGKTFTFSMHKKSTLRPFIEQWTGKKFKTDGEANAFDFDSLVGMNGMMQVMHDSFEKDGETITYAAPQLVLPGKVDLTPENPTVSYNLNVFEPLPEQCPKSIREKIESSDEFLRRATDKAAVGGDDCPF